MQNIMRMVDLSRLMAIDECSVQLISRIRKVVALKGSKPQMKTVYTFQGITVIGGITGNGRIIYKIQDHATKESCFKGFLKYVKSQFSRGRIHTILDNASFHTRNKVKHLSERLSISLHFQPTHSPFLNAAEEIWRQLREYLRGILFYSLEDLKNGIQEFFDTHPTLNINLAKYLY